MKGITEAAIIAIILERLGILAGESWLEVRFDVGRRHHLHVPAKAPRFLKPRGAAAA